jgi:hypothetical protein
MLLHVLAINGIPPSNVPVAMSFKLCAQCILHSLFKKSSPNLGRVTDVTLALSAAFRLRCDALEGLSVSSFE